MQLFRQFAPQRWQPRTLIIGLWLFPLDLLLQSIFRVLSWNYIVFAILIIPIAVLFIVCSSRLANSHPLLKQVGGWEPFSSFFRPKERLQVDASDLQIKLVAYQRAYAVILIISYLFIAASIFFMIAFPQLTIGHINLASYFLITTTLVWLVWLLPITFMAWQIQKVRQQ